MTGGWLEHEIRSFPQVLACSITKDDVVVLVQPSADPVAVERSVNDLLRLRGVDLPIRVFGGVRPVFVEPVRIGNGPRALVGSLGGALILAAGVWLAGSGMGLQGNNGSRSAQRTELTLAPPVVRELVEAPSAGPGPPAQREEPREEPPEERPPGPVPILKPVSRPPVLAPLKPPPTPPEVPPKPPGDTPTTASCNAPHQGDAVVPKTGRGNGPPPWSHSIHVPAHCDHGRPR